MAIAFEVSSTDSILIHGFLIPSTLDWLFNLPFETLLEYMNLCPVRHPEGNKAEKFYVVYF
jgi:hypothetical protein